MVIKHGRVIQRKHAWSQHNFPEHPEMNDITLPAYSENQPEGFQKGKIRAALSNAKLTYRPCAAEGKQHSSAPEARVLCVTRKAATDEWDPNGVYLTFPSTAGKEVKSFLRQRYINK